PKHKTEVFAFCTDEALYLGFKCHDPKPDELKMDADAIWSRDEVEIFLEPFKDTIRRAYHQLLIDANGSKQTLRHHVYTKAGGQGINEQWSPDFEVAAGKNKESWMVEVKLPFDQLKLTDEAKQKKTLWRLNLNRARPERGDESAMETAWSPTENKSFHTASKFGYALPEVYSSPELLDSIWKEVNEVKLVANELPLAVPFEIRKRIGELGSEVFTERDEAIERLKKLAGLSEPAYTTLETELKEALERSREQDVISQVRKLLGEIKSIKQQGELNDDTPPDHLRQLEEQ
ncbi:MAG: sugar-binding protein, partial [Chloroflexota bacterium]